MSEQVGYQFGPSEPRGVFLGQSGGQLGLLAVDAFVFIQLVNPDASWSARVVLVAVLGLALVWGYLPVRGETPLGWTRRWVLFRLQKVTGHHEYDGGVFRVARNDIEIPAARLPGLLGATRFIELSTGPGSAPIVVAHDQREATYTAVLQLEGDSFYVLEAVEQQRRVDAYGRMHGALCRPGSVIRRLQILERTVPDTSDTLERDLNTRASDALDLFKSHTTTAATAWAASGQPVNGRGPANGHSPTGGHDAVNGHDAGSAATATPVGVAEAERGVRFATEGYRQLIAAAGPAGRRHEVFVALAIDGAKAGKEISKSGGGDIGAAAVVAREVNTLAANLAGCGVKVTGWAPPRLLGYILRTAYDPAATDTIDRRGGGSNDVAGGTTGLPSGVDLRQAGPHKALNMWDCYRTDTAFHRTFWVAEWPRREAPAAFLGPLLTYAEGRRAISLVYEPRDARAAGNSLIRKKNKAEAESGLRAKFRLRRSKRAEQNVSHLDRREDELLAGEALLALRAYVTISAPSRDELDLVEAEVFKVAQESMIELQPMTGAHDQGFAVGAVPMARSL